MTVLAVWQTGRFTEDQVCASFKITHREFRDALKTNGLSMPQEYSQGLEDEVNAVYATEEDIPLATLAQMYHISFNRLFYNYLQRRPYIPQSSLADEIRDYLTNYPSEKKSDVAKHFGVTAAYISILAPREQKRRSNITDAEWADIKPRLKTNSVNAVAKQFGITRSSIYYRLKKDA